MNNRRSLVIALGACASVPGTVFAQAKNPPVVIGWLGAGAADMGSLNLQLFKEALAALGRTEGADFVVDARWAGGSRARLEQLATELAARRPGIIVTAPRSATLTAVKAAPGIPVVQMQGGSLVEYGFAGSLARPGGIVTGLVNLNVSMVAKHTELLADVIPQLQRVGFLLDTTMGTRKTLIETADRAASRFRARAMIAEVATVSDLEPAIADLRKNQAQAVVVLPANWLASERRRIVSLSQSQQLAVVASQAAWIEVGALMSYGSDLAHSARRAAWYADQILKGKKPGDLPIEQPTRFVLAVNRKTAKALGITIPRWIMLHADRVIG